MLTIRYIKLQLTMQISPLKGPGFTAHCDAPHPCQRITPGTVFAENVYLNGSKQVM